MNREPRKAPMVFAFAGDSTITRDFPVTIFQRYGETAKPAAALGYNPDPRVSTLLRTKRLSPDEVWQLKSEPSKRESYATCRFRASRPG
jgi:hypothetical protein